MELGAISLSDLQTDPTTGQPYSAEQRLEETLGYAALTDRRGLDVFALGEHHTLDFAVSSPRWSWPPPPAEPAGSGSPAASPCCRCWTRSGSTRTTPPEPPPAGTTGVQVETQAQQPTRAFACSIDGRAHDGPPSFMPPTSANPTSAKPHRSRTSATNVRARRQEAVNSLLLVRRHLHPVVVDVDALEHEDVALDLDVTACEPRQTITCRGWPVPRGPRSRSHRACSGGGGPARAPGLRRSRRPR
jgi:hypothetical protein